MKMDRLYNRSKLMYNLNKSTLKTTTVMLVYKKLNLSKSKRNRKTTLLQQRQERQLMTKVQRPIKMNEIGRNTMINKKVRKCYLKIKSTFNFYFGVRI